MKKFFGFNISDELAGYFESDLSTNRDMEDATILLENGIMPYRDGNLWCVLIGENLQSGICGFGITIHEAFVNFMIDVKEMQKRMSSEQPSLPEGLEEEVRRYFQGYWPGMETAEQCNTDMHFTPPAIMRLAYHFYELGCRHAVGQEPQGLDDAAEEYFNNNYGDGSRTIMEDVVNDFKAGAKWIAGQGFVMGATFRVFDDENPFVNFDNHEDSKRQSMKLFKDGDKVIVTIRKKDE